MAVGVGWLEEEFAALGAPPFERRGAVTDEWIEIFKAIWTKPDPTFEGRHALKIVPADLPPPLAYLRAELAKREQRASSWSPKGSASCSPCRTEQP